MDALGPSDVLQYARSQRVRADRENDRNGLRLLLYHSRRRPPEVMITSGARPTSSAAEARIWLRFAARGHPAALAEALDSWPH